MSRDRPRVSIDPAVQGGTPCCSDTRIPAEMMARVWWEGQFTKEQMLESWPSLTVPDLLVAFWYMGVYGGARWRRRFGLWAKNVHGELWNLAPDYETLPWPSQKEEALR